MSNDITIRINEKFDELSKGQKKIAQAVLDDYDKAAYLTAAKLAELVGVSESTVVRFAVVIGYKGYFEFQLALQELVRSKLTSNQRIEVTKQRIGLSDAIATVMESDIENIRFTMERLDRVTFKSAVEAIISARNIYITGARSTELIARLLHYNLSLIFDNVKFINPTSGSEIFEQMYSIGKEDVFIAFSFPRYSSKIINAANFAKDKEAKVVVVTDSENSPLSEFSDYLITAQSDMVSFMDSLVAPLSIVNAIVTEITSRRESEITERFDSLEKIWDEYKVYAKR